MTGTEIIQQVKSLSLPADEYVVYGSCPMAIAGIREASDVDMYVTPRVYQQLVSQGWKIINKGPGDTPATMEVFEVHDNWDFSPYSPSLAHLQTTATIVDEVPFASLEEVRKWKAESGGLKNLEDVRLIDNYLKENEYEAAKH